jgi:hypothetical protein
MLKGLEFFYPKRLAFSWGRGATQTPSLISSPIAKRCLSITAPAFIDTYLEKRRAELKTRTFLEVDRHLRKHWAPLLACEVRSLTRADLVRVIDVPGMVPGARVDRCESRCRH